MVTTKISLPAYLAEYAVGKWGFLGPDYREEPVCFPDNTELYLLVHDLTQKRPLDAQFDKGNLEIVIPNRRKDGEAIRKNPEVYNYLSERSCIIIKKRIQTLLWAELHTLLDENKHRYGIEYLETVHSFRCAYRISSLTDDALLKNYYRWRNSLRKKERRSYRKKRQNTLCTS